MRIPIKVYETVPSDRGVCIPKYSNEHLENVGGQLYLVSTINKEDQS